MHRNVFSGDGSRLSGSEGRRRSLTDHIKMNLRCIHTEKVTDKEWSTNCNFNGCIMEKRILPYRKLTKRICIPSPFNMYLSIFTVRSAVVDRSQLKSKRHQRIHTCCLHDAKRKNCIPMQKLRSSTRHL